MKRKSRRSAIKYGPEWERISRMRCLICHRRSGPAHHVKTVGTGGLDKGNLVPLCVDHHEEVHRGRDTFARKYDIDLEQIAKELEQ